MGKTLTNARFFFKSDVHSWLFNKYDNIDKKRFFNNCSFGYDIIDQPFYCSVSSGEGHINIKLYVRSEMGAFLENPDLGVSFSTNGEKPKVTANTGRLGGNPGEMIMLFYKAAIILGMQIEENGLVDDYTNMNTDEEGLLVSLNEDALSFEHVTGKDRPTMACTTLFGGMQMMRPYQNEIIDSWMGNNDEHWGENYSDTDEDTFDNDEDASNLPDGYMTALEAFDEAEEYENELADEGVIPGAPRPGNGIMTLSPEGFPRIALKAEEGDERAIAILVKMKKANEMG